MENTLENKAKFFALYLGQKVMRCKTFNATTGNGLSGLMNVDVNSETIKENWFLELKPLSSLSDEDAIQVAKLNVYRYADGRRSTYYEHYLNVMGENPIKYVKSILINTVHWDELSLKCYDLLRLKGCALPFMGFPVEELVNRSWVKLKGETK